MSKPLDLFDREWEWDQLARFSTRGAAGAALGVVSGRRRQGKSFLLQALCELTGGFYHSAVEATEAESLRRLGEHLARHLGMPAAVTLPSWEAAIDALLRADTLVVLDEFPFLARATPSLPSVVQAAFAPRSTTRRRSRTRLILCGSALSFMGKLLSGDAPLRGRAGLELVVQTFDFRVAARFWGIQTDPVLALLVHSVVGGTPAYRREFVGDDAPSGRDDFDDWIVRTVLNPACPLFREGRYLLAEEHDLRDTAVYHSVLAACAEGRTSRGEIAAALHRPPSDLAHALSVLEDIGLIARTQDCLRRGRPVYAVREPIVRFYHAVMRPSWGRLERPGHARQVWAESRDRFESAILGPHFEQLCREWSAHYASTSLLGGRAAQVGAGVVTDRVGRSRIDVDVVVKGERSRRGTTPLLALGEAKWGQRVGATQVARLRRARELLSARSDLDTSGCRLLLFSGAGVDGVPGDDVTVVDPALLYSSEPSSDPGTMRPHS